MTADETTSATTSTMASVRTNSTGFHALGWKLLDRADEPGVQRILEAVAQLIDERTTDPDWRQRRPG